MSVILQARSCGDSQVNAWTWRPAVQLLAQHLGFSSERCRKLLTAGIGEEVSGEEARRMAEFLNDFLDAFPVDGRLLLDGSIMKEPKRYLPVEEMNMSSYSASYDWLIRFRDFCSDSDGFVVG